MKNVFSFQAEIDVAESIRQEKYTGASAFFLAGSIVRGEGTTYSDLDIVVVYERLPAAYRESFMFSSWPVEVFVHDPATLAYFFDEFDRKRGVPSLATMLSEGLELPKTNSFSSSCKELANEVLSKGPATWNQTDIDASRYLITNLVDDMRHPCSGMDVIAVGAALYNALATHVFRTRGMWSATGKMIPRQMEKTLPEIAGHWQEGFTCVFETGDCDSVISLVEALLEPDGGLLFDGYTQTAPVSWRYDSGI